MLYGESVVIELFAVNPKPHMLVQLDLSDAKGQAFTCRPSLVAVAPERLAQLEALPT